MFEDFAVGDIIKTHRTLEVTQKGPVGLYGRDPRNGDTFYVAPGGTLTYEIVSKAKPPEPKVGDTITGAQLLDLPWPAGTVVESQAGAVYLRITPYRSDQSDWRSDQGGSLVSPAPSYTI